MIDWAPEAIEAAHCAMFQEPYDGKTAALIGAGLDAAAAAQGIKDEENTRLREENARLRGDFSAQSAIVKLAEQQAEIDALKELIRDLAGDLEEEIYTRYGENGRKCMPDRYERDMQSVIKAREIIGETK